MNALEEVREVISPYLTEGIFTAYDHEGYAKGRRTPRVYLHALRPPELNESDEEYLGSVYPFIVLKPTGGEASVNGVDSSWNGIRVTAVIGICAPGEDMQGNRDVSAIIDRILQAVGENPYTKHCRFSDEIDWQIDDEAEHPYYYGTVSLTVYDRLTTRAEYDI